MFSKTNILLMLIALLVLDSLWLMSSEDSALTLESLEASPPSIDLGTIMAGSKHDFQSVLSNCSNGNLTVQRVRGACSCTSLKLNRTDIPIGGNAILSGTVTAPSKGGVFQTFVLVHSDPKPITIPITGMIEPWVEAVPTEVMVSPNYESGLSNPSSFVIRNRTSKDVQLISDNLPKGLLIAPAADTLIIPANGESDFLIRVDGNLLVKKKLLMQFQTSLPSQPIVDLTVNIDPVDGLELVPDGIALGVVTSEQLMNLPATEILLEGEMLRRFEIKEVDIPNFMKCTVSQKSPTRIAFTTQIDKLPVGSNLNQICSIGLHDVSLNRDVVVEFPVTGILIE